MLILVGPIASTTDRSETAEKLEFTPPLFSLASSFISVFEEFSPSCSRILPLRMSALVLVILANVCYL
jgi:hypothetical protein